VPLVSKSLHPSSSDDASSAFTMRRGLTTLAATRRIGLCGGGQFGYAVIVTELWLALLNVSV
jgi:hypothetical protein